MKQHFLNAELHERKHIQDIYNSYFVPRGCDALDLTSINTFAPLDAYFRSGSTRVAAEIKCRDISISKFPYDTLIEFRKWSALRNAYETSGLTPLYIVVFNDAISIFNLTSYFDYEISLNVPIEHFFSYVYADANGSRDTFKKEKLIRFIPFASATVLDNNFQPFAYTPIAPTQSDMSFDDFLKDLDSI